VSYRNIVVVTDRLSQRLRSDLSSEIQREEVYADLIDFVELMQDTACHTSIDPEVQHRLHRLHTSLSQALPIIASDSVHQHMQDTIAAALELIQDVQAPDHPTQGIDPNLLLDELESIELLRDDKIDLLLHKAQRELDADPTNILAAFLHATALLCLNESEQAMDAAKTLAQRYPARHVFTICALAAARSGDPDQALIQALNGMQCRLEAQRPEHWYRISGLREPTELEAETIRRANIIVIQKGLEWVQETGWSPNAKNLLTGLLAPSLGQAYQILKTHIDDIQDPGWLTIARSGLARCARWRCEYHSATLLLEGIQTRFAQQERELIIRDEALLNSCEVELVGHGHRLVIGRTPTSTTFSWKNGHHKTPHPDRSDAQIADLMKDLVTSWIETGFTENICTTQTVADDETPATDPVAVDVEYFFSLYESERLDDILIYALGKLETNPTAVTAWGLVMLVYSLRGHWGKASRASEKALALSGCRSLAIHRAFMPLLRGDLGATLSVAMDNLTFRLRSATPREVTDLASYPAIRIKEGELLDQIEQNAWLIIEKIIERYEPDSNIDRQQIDVIAALLTPNPVVTIEQLQRLMPDLVAAPHLQAAAATALARWKRHEGRLQTADKWLSVAEQAVPHLSFTQEERKRLTRDMELMDKQTVCLYGYGLTIEVSRKDRFLSQTQTSTDGSICQSSVSQIDDSSDDAVALALRNAALVWLESGFQQTDTEIQ